MLQQLNFLLGNFVYDYVQEVPLVWFGLVILIVEGKDHCSNAPQKFHKNISFTTHALYVGIGKSLVIK